MAELLHLAIERLETPLGELAILSDRQGRLRAVDWTDHESRMERLLELRFGRGGFRLDSVSEKTISRDALERYFAGELSAIDELPVEGGGTPFQRLVWNELRAIPCGQTCSYAQLAERIGKPAAVRAVGLANGSNPIGIVVPCHRVIGADGSLTGYGGGIERKRWLLNHEAAGMKRKDAPRQLALGV